MPRTARPAKAAPISASFLAHKSAILSSLGTPAESYTDLSPKGSVDHQILDLINEINSLDGVVTTSSCSGRVSVFVEGQKTSTVSSSVDGKHDIQERESSEQRSVPGGKGLDGRWLFVSHDSLPVDDHGEVEIPSELQNLISSTITQHAQIPLNPRLIHLSFEPLILHVCTASLLHAKPILALALDAGFREAGLQSLKCLKSEHAFPMVAIRSAGLGFSTVVGYVDEDGAERLMIGRKVLRMMMSVANGRFVENERRTERVRKGFQELIKTQEVREEVDWEDKEERAARKKAEGLKRQHRIISEQDTSEAIHNSTDEGSLLGLAQDLSP